VKSHWIWKFLPMALIWGSSFLFTELSLRFLPYFGVAFWRTFLGGLAMFALVFLLKLQLPKGTQWFHLWVAGVFMSAIPFSLFSYAQQFTTSSLAAIIGAATPMFTLLAILTIYRTEKVTMVATVGLMVGLIGVAVTLGVWEGFGQNDPLAIGALVLATISYGIGGPYIRKFVTPMNLSGTSSAAAQVFTSAITPFSAAIAAMCWPSPVAAAAPLGSRQASLNAILAANMGGGAGTAQHGGSAAYFDAALVRAMGAAAQAASTPGSASAERARVPA
jgi:drug/metabolite transporter (DMT)-like permease